MQQPYGAYPGAGQYVDPSTVDAGSSGLLWGVITVAFLLVVGVLFMIFLVKQFLFIARPNEAVVLSGKGFVTENGTRLGYRVVQQGRRGFRIPVLHRLDRMDMRTLPVDIVVQNAYSAGNIPLKIHAIANVKVHSDPRFIGNAIERFLGRAVREIQLVAQQTLEGAVREVIATLTPEEVNEDRLKFAEKLIETAEDDLHKLGLQLDTLKIQNVSDETGYLDSLGRPRIAAALQDAENAENEAQQEITRAQAEAGRRAEVAKAAAETSILQQQNELRRVRAELEGQAQSVEREAEAAAKTARAEAEKELQTLRTTLEQKRLQAEVVIPAEVQQKARAILAVGEAAPTAENGAAAVHVLQLMSEAWKAMGPQAREIYVIQHLDEIVGTVVKSLDDVKVGEVNVLDPGDGSGLASYAATYPQMVASVMRALGETTGVDVPAILAGEIQRRSALRGGV
jgi:flotillin